VLPLLRDRRGYASFQSGTLFLLLAILQSSVPCNAKLIPKRDPLDGALDATLIVIMKQQAKDTFRVEESFLGGVGIGGLLRLPGFKLVVEDRSSFRVGVERIEPIYNGTRILVFLKPAKARIHGWDVAGFGNCYFWSHDPGKPDSLRAMAVSALDLRRSWEAARGLSDNRQRVEALWPYLWNHNGSCYKQTEAVLREAGSVAGDYIAGQLSGMTYQQKMFLLPDFGKYPSELLHAALIRELKRQEAAWEELLRRRGEFARYDEVNPPDRIHDFARRPQDAESDEAEEIDGVLYYGFAGLTGFHDRSDLPFIRESALWGVKYRFKQLDDAALGAFAEMPDKANLPVIEAIWKEYSTTPWTGNELSPFDVMRTLEAHRFPEAIPLMAQFVNVSFAPELAQRFLKEMTGVDFGNDSKRWREWYESHKH
jgi:hypothetical protein